jgi:hypothetical protein
MFNEECGRRQGHGGAKVNPSVRVGIKVGSPNLLKSLRHHSKAKWFQNN